MPLLPLPSPALHSLFISFRVSLLFVICLIVLFPAVLVPVCIVVEQLTDLPPAPVLLLFYFVSVGGVSHLGHLRASFSSIVQKVPYPDCNYSHGYSCGRYISLVVRFFSSVLLLFLSFLPVAADVRKINNSSGCGIVVLSFVANLLALTELSLARWCKL